MDKLRGEQGMVTDITYRIYVIDMMVHEWSEEGQGEYVCTMGGYEAGSYRTPEKLREGLEQQFPGIELVQDDLAHLRYFQVENEEGYRDDNGRFIVDYSITIEKVQVEPYIFEEVQVEPYTIEKVQVEPYIFEENK
jgi:hypothetical protein